MRTCMLSETRRSGRPWLHDGTVPAPADWPQLPTARRLAALRLAHQKDAHRRVGRRDSKGAVWRQNKAGSVPGSGMTAPRLAPVRLRLGRTVAIATALACQCTTGAL